MAAGVGVGIFKDFNSATGLMEFDRKFEPDACAMEKYKKYYDVYKMLYPSLKPVYEKMSELHY